MEPGGDVFPVEFEVVELNGFVVDDVLHLRVHGHAQRVHAGSLDGVGVDECRDQVEEPVELCLVQVAGLVLVGEEPDGEHVGPHSVRGVVEDEQPPQDPVGEPLLGVDGLPEREQAFQVVERFLALQLTAFAKDSGRKITIGGFQGPATPVC